MLLKSNQMLFTAYSPLLLFIFRATSTDDAQRRRPHDPEMGVVIPHERLSFTKLAQKASGRIDTAESFRSISESAGVASYYSFKDPVSKVLKIDYSQSTKKPGKPPPGTLWPDAFYFGTLDTFFLPWLTVKSKIGMVGIVLFTAFLAMAYEYVKFYRNSYLYWVCIDGHVHCNTQLISDQSNYNYTSEEMVELQIPMFANARCKQTILHGTQVFLKFLLIMSFMTMNLWVVFGIFFGTFIGFFLFSCRLPYFCKDFSDYAEY